MTIKANLTTVTALLDTIAKKRTEQSSNLEKNQILPFPRGKTYPVENWTRVGNHIKATLGYEAGTWFFYEPHVEIRDGNGTVLDGKSIAIPRTSKVKTLTDEDYRHGADLIGCPVSALKAVVAVESAGFGFYGDKPKILFEAHWFATLTNHRFDRSHPTLSSPRWNRALYLGGSAEWIRLENAKVLDRNSAIQSASWGLFQVMGFHYHLCYPNVEEFYSSMFQSEWEHLKIAIAFIKSKKLDRHLRNKSWAAFAYGFNGSGYRVNQYDRKLAQAYARFA